MEYGVFGRIEPFSRGSLVTLDFLGSEGVFRSIGLSVRGYLGE